MRVHDPYFFTSPDGLAEGRVKLNDSDLHHLNNVRRVKPGELVKVSDGAGRVVTGKIVDIAHRQLMVDVIQETLVAPFKPFVSVFLAVTKARGAESALKKLVEMGVDEVVIFMANRSVPHWSESSVAKAGARFSSIAIEASKQSRRAWLPKVRGPLTEARAIEAVRLPAFVGDLRAENSLRTILPEAPEELSLVIGPEGGLSPDEALAWVGAGASTVRVGPGVMRATTAALVMASAVLYHYGRLD